MNKLVVKTFYDFDNLPQQLIDTWHRLSQGNPFVSYDWFKNLRKTVVEEETQPFVVVIQNSNSDLVAIIPLKNQIKSWWRTRWTLSLANYYTPVYYPLVDEEKVSNIDVARCICAYLRNSNCKWDAINLNPLYHNEQLSDFESALAESDLFSLNYRTTVNWYHEVDDYQTYLSSRPSRLINTINRKGRKLKKNFNVEFKVIDTQAHLTEALAAFQKIYSVSWKKPEPYPEFIPGLVDICAANGWLKLSILRLDDEPVAAQFWFVSDETAYIYKLAYDPKYTKYSVGTVLTAMMMEYVIEKERVKKIDFLTGDDNYKKDWMDSKKQMYGLLILNTKRVRGYLLYLKELVASYLKKKRQYR